MFPDRIIIALPMGRGCTKSPRFIMLDTSWRTIVNHEWFLPIIANQKDPPSVAPYILPMTDETREQIHKSLEKSLPRIYEQHINDIYERIMQENYEKLIGLKGE